MNQNSKFSSQLLGKIGAPLAAAIEAVPLKGEDTDVEAAKIMAQMLGQSVQISIALNNALGVVESEEQADSTRLALAALSAPLLAGFYRQNARVAEDQDIKRIVKSLEAVLAFAENFTPAADGASRLATIDHDAPLFDETQVSFVVMQAMTPVIDVIADFPFGQSETKLIQDVSQKLKDVAAQLSQSGDKLAELMALKALAQVYADCHAAETARLASSSDESRGELSLDPVWKAFDIKVAMIEAVLGMNSEPAQTSTGSQSPAPIAPPVGDVQAAPNNNPVPELNKPPEAPAAPLEEVPVATGPMGFFKPGAKIDPAASPAAPAETPAPIQPTEQAPQQAQEQPQAQAQPTPAAAPDEQPASPMGFFKPGAKKADNGEGSSS